MGEFDFIQQNFRFNFLYFILFHPLHSDCNVAQRKISNRHIRFMQDIFTTLVDSQWRWTLIIFVLTFVISWLGFAVIWWLIAATHGDLEIDHLPSAQGKFIRYRISDKTINDLKQQKLFQAIALGFHA